MWRGAILASSCFIATLILVFTFPFLRDTVKQRIAQQHVDKPHFDTIHSPPPSKPSTFAKGELVMIAASSGTGGFLGIPNLKNMVYENRVSYAQKWGHEFMWANMSSYNFTKVAWNKIPIIQDAQNRYPKAKWFWWLDLDAIIMNMSSDIYDTLLSPEGMAKTILLDTDITKIGGGPSGFKTPATMDPNDVNMLITFDDWGMNTGSFFMKRSEWTDIVLEMWADPAVVARASTFYDQDGWVDLYQHHPFVRKNTGLVRQKVMNGYPDYNFLGQHWETGGLVVHFAGCSAGKNLTRCENYWHKYWDQREKDENMPSWIMEQISNGTAGIEIINQDKEGKP